MRAVWIWALSLWFGAGLSAQAQGALVNPVWQWARSPTRSDVAQVYPDSAWAAASENTKFFGGSGSIECVLGEDGRPSECRPGFETPAGSGFSQATLRLAHLWQGPQVSAAPVAVGSRFSIQLRFQPVTRIVVGPRLVGVDDTDLQPWAWAGPLSLAPIAAVADTERELASVGVICVADATGRLNQCEVARDKPTECFVNLSGGMQDCRPDQLGRFEQQGGVIARFASLLRVPTVGPDGASSAGRRVWFVIVLGSLMVPPSAPPAPPRTR
jgi:hypothetical protein